MKNKNILAKLLTVILVVAVVSAVMPVSVTAWWTDTGVSPDADTSAVVQSGACGDNIVYELRESGNLFISGTGPMFDYETTAAPWRGYAYDKRMYVYFDSGVTYIGKNAFERCYALQHVTFPDTLVEIGDCAFKEAAELGSIVLPEGLTTIGAKAFALCGYPGLDGYNFTSVKLPSTIKTIGDQAFSMCGRLSSINLPEGLETLGRYVFASCFYLTKIEIPDSVTSIGSGIFNSCSRLTDLRLPDNLEVLPSDMFSALDSGKASMTEITLPLNLKTVEKTALDSWDLQRIYIPGNVESLAYRAFGRFKGTIYFSGDAPQFHPETFYWNNVTIYYPQGNKTWDGIVGQNFGCTITWIAHDVANSEHKHAYKNGVCTVCGETEPHELVLTKDMQINRSLARDLYIDLNGFDLSGTIVTNGFKVYGMDSTTDSYTCDSIGYFTCVDENGNFIVPERIYTEGEKQYMAICTEDRYSFHRFFVGITHMTLAPETVGLGYKTAVYGDEMVFSQLDAFTFQVQLEGYNPVYRHFGSSELASGDPITLRIRNYDVENYSEHNLYAQVSLTLNDGTTIEAEQVSLTFRWLTEQVNANYTDYTNEQIAQFKAMLQAFDIVKKWDIPNLI